MDSRYNAPSHACLRFKYNRRVTCNYLKVRCAHSRMSSRLCSREPSLSHSLYLTRPCCLPLRCCVAAGFHVLSCALPVTRRKHRTWSHKVMRKRMQEKVTKNAFIHGKSNEMNGE